VCDRPVARACSIAWFARRRGVALGCSRVALASRRGPGRSMSAAGRLGGGENALDLRPAVPATSYGSPPPLARFRAASSSMSGR